MDERDVEALVSPPAWLTRLTIDEHNAFLAARWVSMNLRAVFNRLAWARHDWPAPLRFDA